MRRSIGMVAALAMLVSVLGGCGGSSGGGGSGAVEISQNYLQYRSFPNAEYDHFRAWVAMSRDGAQVEASVVAPGGVTLYAPSGLPLVPASTPSFHTGSILFTEWDTELEAFTPAENVQWSGFTLDLSNYETMEAGDYTFEVELASGGTLTSTFYFPGLTQAPVIGSLSFVENPDDSGTFSWEEPEAFYHYAYIVLLDQMVPSAHEIFYARIPKGLNSFTFTKAQIEELAEFTGPITELHWQMQARIFEEQLEGASVNVGRSKSVPYQIF